MTTISLASDATTRKRIFRRFALGEDALDGLARDIATYRVAAYEARLAQLADAMGMDVEPSLYDSRVLGNVNADARGVAFDVLHTHNSDLRNFLAQQPNGLSQAELARRVRDWETHRQDWKSQQIAQTEGYTAFNQADKDVMARNKLQIPQRVTPQTAEEEKCEELISRGWMRPSDIDFSLPLHPHCNHSFEYQQSLASAVQDKPRVWLGDWYPNQARLEDDEEKRQDDTSDTGDTTTGSDSSDTSDGGTGDSSTDDSSAGSSDAGSSSDSSGEGSGAQVTVDTSGDGGSDVGSTTDTGTGSGSATPDLAGGGDNGVSEAAGAAGGAVADSGQSDAGDAGDGAEAGGGAEADAGTGGDTGPSDTGVSDSAGGNSPVGPSPVQSVQVAPHITAVKVGAVTAGHAVSRAGIHIALARGGLLSQHASHAQAVQGVKAVTGLHAVQQTRTVHATRLPTAQGHVTAVRAGAVHLGTVISHRGAHAAIMHSGLVSQHASHHAAVAAVAQHSGLQPTNLVVPKALMAPHVSTVVKPAHASKAMPARPAVVPAPHVSKTGKPAKTPAGRQPFGGKRPHDLFGRQARAAARAKAQQTQQDQQQQQAVTSGTAKR